VTTILAAAVLAGGTAGYAQEIPPQTAPPAPAAAPAPASPSMEARRLDVKYMETILAGAVRNGAQALAQRMQVQTPGSMIVTGTARARGIVLEGYGVFFDVDVPMMKQSVVWTTRQLIQQDLREKLASLQQVIDHTTDAEELRRARLQQRSLISQLQTLMPGGFGTVLNVPAAPSASVNAGTNIAPVANTTDRPVAAANVQETVAPLPLLQDPNEAYTDAVKRSLIDAMLNYSRALSLGENEWLTVAARDAEDPVPGSVGDASTIVIRIKGADLAAFHANKLSRDEVLKKVEVREF
jgi:hypothetical protein